jgi:uncharacterized protein YndB with AHSA1/START domain
MTSTVSTTIDASTEDVWKVLADGWLYGLWVVGASRIREVDDTWPAPGSRIHHSVGTWPLVINDITEVLTCDPHSELVLQARAWPGGEARVHITVEKSPAGAMVTIMEDASHGPARLIPPPVRRAALGWRNNESLKRLGYLAKRRHTP